MNTLFTFFSRPLLGISLICFLPCHIGNAYQATYFKIGEVDHDSALIWTRTTRSETQNSADAAQIKFEYAKGSKNKIDQHGYKHSIGSSRSGIFKGYTIDDEGEIGDLFCAAPGAKGSIQVSYRIVGTEEWQHTDWAATDPDKDYTLQVKLENLEPFQKYELSVKSRHAGKDDILSQLDGQFHTAPDPSLSVEKIRFVVTTCGDYFKTEKRTIYPAVQKLDPHFFVHTGDILYYDHWAKNKDLADYCWQRFFSDPVQGKPYSQMSTYFMKDDHDTLMNDAYPGSNSEFMGDFTWEQGLKTFTYQVPMGKKTYRTVQWGKDLQVWFLEGRDYRSPNPMPDGKKKSMLGSVQKKWLKDSITKSESTFKVVITPNPIVGPDRPNKNDNLANEGFQTEGKEIREFLGQFENLIVITGDRHWQYASIHPDTGLREYSVGGSGKVGGWSENNFIKGVHTYLKVERGFVSVDLTSSPQKRILQITHHDVSGKPQNINQLVFESGKYSFLLE